MLRRVRLQDGSLGPLEKVFDDGEESIQEKVDNLKKENLELKQEIELQKQAITELTDLVTSIQTP